MARGRHTVDTAVVGAGQAGLTMSYYLSVAGREHVVLEKRSTLGGGWQDRWDQFCLVTPNWSASLPGYPYDGDDPDGFMSRDEIVARIAGYAARIGAPVMLETAVERLSTANGQGFALETSEGSIAAREVVVAIGGYQRTTIPALARDLPARLTQLHSHDYRNEKALPPGAVLIVGSGQTGVQLAEELHDAGRRVFLTVGSATAVPRRYRGRDIVWWLAQVGGHRVEYDLPFPTPQSLPSPAMRLAANPQLTGHGGGHDINMRRMAADGIQLLGRLEAVAGERIRLASDLQANIVRAEGFFDTGFRPMIERYIAAAGIDVPPDDRANGFDFEPSSPPELDLLEAGVSTVIWACGYQPEFGWVDLPIFDEQGMPTTSHGASDVPGLYFLGLPWQTTIMSSNLVGLAWDAPDLASQMGLLHPAEAAGA
jgi:putative flavoprotein involved in K+ transport